RAMAETDERQAKENDGALCGMPRPVARRKTPIVASLNVRKKWRAVCSQSCQHGSEGDARMRLRGVTASTLHEPRVSTNVEQVSTGCLGEWDCLRSKSLWESHRIG